MIIEAAALGVPTVGPNIGGIDEAIVNGETGVLVDKPSPDGLAEAALHLLGNDELRPRMGRRAQRFVRERFDARVHVARLLDMYESDVDTLFRERSSPMHEGPQCRQPSAAAAMRTRDERLMRLTVPNQNGQRV
jgi:hypothetical protein